MDRSKKVFGNEIKESDYRSACMSKRRFVLKYGDDTKQIYHLKAALLAHRACNGCVQNIKRQCNVG